MQVTPSPEQAGGIARPAYAPVGDARDATPKAHSRAMRRVRFVLWNLLPPLTFVAIVALWSAPTPRSSGRIRR